MDPGYKSQNPVPFSQTRTQMLQTFQDSETTIGSSILSGDTLAMEDP